MTPAKLRQNLRCGKLRYLVFGRFRKRAASSPAENPIYCSMESAPKLSAAERQGLEQKIAELGPWFHNFQLADGVWTNPAGGPGPQYPDGRWQIIRPLLPHVSAKSVLDIGCSSGFFSLKLKELGAGYVLGVDAGEQPKAIDQARFAARTLGLDVDFQILSVYDLDRIGREFDIVLFMGVLYHLRHPLLALEAVRRRCRETAIIQSITTTHDQSFNELEAADLLHSSLHSPLLEDPRYPAIRFVEGALDGDVTCWFVPNPQAMMSMLRSCGFKPEQLAYAGRADIFVRCALSW
jgi:tRNA (mo5U34)-methyltransferase